MISKETVEEIVVEWLEDKEYFLVSIEVSQENRIVIEIDHADGVWIDDCVKLSRFIESRLDRDVEDYELEVGSAGLGKPFKVPQQYINFIGKVVEVLDQDGMKHIGVLTSVDGRDFILTVKKKIIKEGAKRPVLADVEMSFSMDKVKYTKYLISFK
ncbi:MAG: ribosome assembly cofactor RimP [Prevotella sp.]|nr:ribosome assembly cofactor RimP [Prevotella sp.]